MNRYIDVDKFAEKICNFQAIDEDAANAMIWLLRTFPTADVVEVRHGEWVKHFCYGLWHYDCPFCDDGFAVAEEFEINQLPHYCSNCGAKMDGRREE